MKEVSCYNGSKFLDKYRISKVERSERLRVSMSTYCLEPQFYSELSLCKCSQCIQWNQPSVQSSQVTFGIWIN